MTTKIIVPCTALNGRHRWRWERSGATIYDWKQRCRRCNKWWDDVHAAWT